MPTNADASVAPPAGEKTEAKADIVKPAEPAVPTAAVSAAAATKADEKDEASPDKKVEEKKPEKTKEERAAERKAEREKQLAEAKAEKEKELHLFTRGSYWETVKWSAGRFPEKAAGDFAFAVVLIGMFLLGAWFVRSGVMANPSAHLPFFRKLAVYGLPIGIGIGLLSSLIACLTRRVIDTMAGESHADFHSSAIFPPVWGMSAWSCSCSIAGQCSHASECWRHWAGWH